jgi:hypothetical protein
VGLGDQRGAKNPDPDPRWITALRTTTEEPRQRPQLCKEVKSAQRTVDELLDSRTRDFVGMDGLGRGVATPGPPLNPAACKSDSAFRASPFEDSPEKREVTGSTPVPTTGTPQVEGHRD